MKNKSWSRKKLTQMLYHGFIGTIADNSVEIGWILCFSLLADKSLVEHDCWNIHYNSHFSSRS